MQGTERSIAQPAYYYYFISIFIFGVCVCLKCNKIKIDLDTLNFREKIKNMKIVFYSLLFEIATELKKCLSHTCCSN